MSKRADGKEMLGCWVSGDLIRAINEWRRRPENQGKSKTDFVVEAALEKMVAEDVAHDRALILQDGRSRLPMPEAKPVNYRTGTKVNSKPASVAGRLAKKAAAGANPDSK